MSYLDILRARLPADEGRKPKPYTDTVGKVTIGVGRNLTDVGLSDDEVDLLLANDIARADAVARDLVPAFDALSDVRKAVVCNMAFNLGRGLRAFTQTLAAINDGRWEDAATAMLDSHWAIQVGRRAQRLAQEMREG